MHLESYTSKFGHLLKSALCYAQIGKLCTTSILKMQPFCAGFPLFFIFFFVGMKSKFPRKETDKSSNWLIEISASHLPISEYAFLLPVTRHFCLVISTATSFSEGCSCRKWDSEYAAMKLTTYKVSSQQILQNECGAFYYRTIKPQRSCI